MVILYIIAVVFILVQFLFITQIWRNCRYILEKTSKSRTTYKPKVSLIVPCKGIDTAFEKNISSFFSLAYDSYELIFVVEDQADEAYLQLSLLRDKFSSVQQPYSVRILIAGVSACGSQKLHNLLYGFKHISSDTEVLCFADSDACAGSDWLSHIVYPLRKDYNAVASGYRWFVPLSNNFATLALTALNGRVAQFLGPTIFNKAWGGSMAVRLDIFKELNMPEIWRTAVSDDLTISLQAKRAGKKVVFVPACLVASYERLGFAEFFEFARRQFLITRVVSFGTWFFALFGSSFTVFGSWGFLFLYLFFGKLIFLITSVVFFASQMLRAYMRQRVMFKLLPADAVKMRFAALADIFGSFFWSVLLLTVVISSAFGRTIIWRSVRYKMLSATSTEKLD